MERCILIYPKWGVVLGAPDRVNIPCLMHDTRLCQFDVKSKGSTFTFSVFVFLLKAKNFNVMFTVFKLNLFI